MATYPDFMELAKLSSGASKPCTELISFIIGSLAQEATNGIRGAQTFYCLLNRAQDIYHRVNELADETEKAKDWDRYYSYTAQIATLEPALLDLFKLVGSETETAESPLVPDSMQQCLDYIKTWQENRKLKHDLLTKLHAGPFDLPNDAWDEAVSIAVQQDDLTWFTSVCDAITGSLDPVSPRLRTEPRHYAHVTSVLRLLAEIQTLLVQNPENPKSIILLCTRCFMVMHGIITVTKCGSITNDVKRHLTSTVTWRMAFRILEKLKVAIEDPPLSLNDLSEQWEMYESYLLTCSDEGSECSSDSEDTLPNQVRELVNLCASIGEHATVKTLNTSERTESLIDWCFKALDLSVTISTHILKSDYNVFQIDPANKITNKVGDKIRVLGTLVTSDPDHDFRTLTNLSKGANNNMELTRFTIRSLAQEGLNGLRGAETYYQFIRKARDTYETANRIFKKSRSKGEYDLFRRPLQVSLLEILKIVDTESEAFIPLRPISMKQSLEFFECWVHNRQILRQASHRLSTLPYSVPMFDDFESAVRHDDVSWISALLSEISDARDQLESQLQMKPTQFARITSVVRLLQEIKRDLADNICGESIRVFTVRCYTIMHWAITAIGDTIASKSLQRHLRSRKIWEDAQRLLGELVDVLTNPGKSLEHLSTKWNDYELYLLSPQDNVLRQEVSELCRRLEAHAGMISDPYQARCNALIKLCIIAQDCINRDMPDDGFERLESIVEQVMNALDIVSSKEKISTKDTLLAHTKSKEMEEAVIGLRTCYVIYQMKVENIDIEMSNALRKDMERLFLPSGDLGSDQNRNCQVVHTGTSMDLANHLFRLLQRYIPYSWNLQAQSSSAPVAYKPRKSSFRDSWSNYITEVRHLERTYERNCPTFMKGCLDMINIWHYARDTGYDVLRQFESETGNDGKDNAMQFTEAQVREDDLAYLYDLWIAIKQIISTSKYGDLFPGSPVLRLLAHSLAVLDKSHHERAVALTTRLHMIIYGILKVSTSETEDLGIRQHILSYETWDKLYKMADTLWKSVEESPSPNLTRFENDLTKYEEYLLKPNIQVIDLTGFWLKLGDQPAALGGNSDIYKAQLTSGLHPHKEQLVAVKVLRVTRSHHDSSSRDRLERRLIREIRVWCTLDHPRIVPFLGYGVDGEVHCLIAPWYSYGNVLKYIRENPNKDKSLLVLESIDGLVYLHSHEPPVVHGDLKASNILVDDSGHARIADFGVSKIFQEELMGFNNTPTGMMGTCRWMAPELLRDGSRPTAASDVYAFSLLALEIYTGKVPFSHITHDGQFVSAINQGQSPLRSHYTPFEAPEEVWQVFEKGWSYKPEQRPSALIFQYMFSSALDFTKWR
ncbi:hypothetical protein FRC03_000845 [Tulasnella sp. 419]|nr:hypothetical protein FRC03_000845 [Tulasnella sp. 419]